MWVLQPSTSKSGTFDVINYHSPATRLASNGEDDIIPVNGVTMSTVPLSLAKAAGGGYNFMNSSRTVLFLPNDTETFEIETIGQQDVADCKREVSAEVSSWVLVLITIVLVLAAIGCITCFVIYTTPSTPRAAATTVGEQQFVPHEEFSANINPFFNG